MSHATRADKLLIKPTAGARPASPRTPGRFIRKARTSGLTPDESQAARTTPPWQRPLTDRLIDSHRRLTKERANGGSMSVVKRRPVGWVTPELLGWCEFGDRAAITAAIASAPGSARGLHFGSVPLRRRSTSDA